MQNINQSSETDAIARIGIESYYQPLYSVREKKFIGVEALSRGLVPTGAMTAHDLFNCPSTPRENLHLNIRCIKSALLNAEPSVKGENFVVFLNFDSSLIDYSEDVEEILLQILYESEMDCSRVVIELIESKVGDMERLIRFVHFFREKGILIALDDVGSGYSSYERIARIHPDIIKIDRGLVDNLSCQYHKREVCRSLIDLSRNIGALSLAEGVETLEDALCCQDLGADLIQGFFFTPPCTSLDLRHVASETISLLVERWTAESTERESDHHRMIKQVKDYACWLSLLLKERSRKDWLSLLTEEIGKKEVIQCAYLLDESGIQISPTVMNPKMSICGHRLFTPAIEGTDHGFKPYFRDRQKDQFLYISRPYLSRATGQLCRTVSQLFSIQDSCSVILCIDIRDEV